MELDLGRVGGGLAGRPVGRWAGGLAAVALLSIATAAGAFQQAARPTTTVPSTAASSTAAPPAPKTYAECLRSYAGRTNGTAVCQRLFPNAAPAAAPATTSTTGAPTTPPREPVDITPQLNKLLEAWGNRPKTQPEPPPGTTRPSTDPLAVIPEIQAACATYASVPERWRRCVGDAWRTAGMRGQPPLVLQNPPVVERPPVQPPVTPPVTPPPVTPPVERPPVRPPVGQYKPPIQTPPPLTPEQVRPEPVQPPSVVEPDLPPVAVVEPPPKPPPVVPPAVPPPEPSKPTIPVWFWLAALAALAAAVGGGFGLAKWLGRARPGRVVKPAQVASAPCAPQIALVADPGVVVLTPDGPPRAGMAVSVRVECAADSGEVRLDYPTLETAP